MQRRQLIALLGSLGLVSQASCAPGSEAPQVAPLTPDGEAPRVAPLKLSDAEWKKRLSPAQYRVLRSEGTEAPFTSALNDEKRPGTYHCAGCDLPLFASDAKYDSGTGWPSFYRPLPGAVQTRTDYQLIFPRTEYHCARCEGHQGHVFGDGPKPTGKRYCNNGVAIRFVVAAA